MGYLEGGFDNWKSSGFEVDTIDSVSVTELADLLKSDSDLNIYDVRKEGEYEAEHIENVHYTPLAYINNHMSEFKKEGSNYIHCASGFRSMIAISILKARGIHNVVNISGGFKAIQESGLIPVTDFVCQSTKK